MRLNLGVAEGCDEADDDANGQRLPVPARKPKEVKYGHAATLSLHNNSRPGHGARGREEIPQ
ncbi:hypothetical protein ACFPRL_23475 [Pseudoclavibacter helvolus]